MKILAAFLLSSCWLLAQNESFPVIDFGGGIVQQQTVNSINLGQVVVSNTQYYWNITRAANGDKTFTFSAMHCVYATVAVVLGVTTATISLLPQCRPLDESAAEILGPVSAAMVQFIHLAPNVPHYWVYDAAVRAAGPRLTTAQPNSPADPSIVFLDGFSYNLVKFDLATSSVAASVALPQQARTFAVRPTTAGAQNEVWSVHGGTVNEISVADLGAGSVLATIPTPSLDPNNSNPTGIVFTNDGATAYYAAAFYSPDSSGNRGALLIFDAVNRKLTSTVPLTILPTALIMAPDGLTAYLIGSGKILYYDILSGTADLTAPFPVNLATFGTTTFGASVFIHPDGTRLFFDDNTRAALGVFDLTTRQVTNEFSYGLPNGEEPAVIQMSQDGSTISMADSAENVYSLDTRFGNVLLQYASSYLFLVFPGPVIY